MPDPAACSVTMTVNSELVESQDGKTDFIAVTLSINDKEQEMLILPVEEE